MITEHDKLNRYSKNMASINYWMCQQGFHNYNSLQWQTDSISNKTQLLNLGGHIVCDVRWYCIISKNIEYFIPIFEFVAPHWNANQTSFWITRHITKELES